MENPHVRTWTFPAALAASWALCATVAAAQPAATLDRFRAAPTPEDDLHLARATDLGHLRLGAHLVFDYGLDPLVYESVSGDSGTEGFAVVRHQLVGTLGLSLGLFDRVVVFAGLPATLVMDGDTDPALMATGVQAADGAGLGDAFLGARVRLLGAPGDLLALALQARVTAPSSGVPDDVAYRGDRSVTFSPELLAELRPTAGIRLVANLGARVRKDSVASLSNLGFGSELTYGLGATFLAWKDETDDRTHLDVLVQAYGDSAFERVGEREGTALEATAGARFAHASGFVATLAAGPGLARGFGSPDLRGVLQLGWATPTAAPVRDTDGDGLFDDIDRCVTAPEDVDTFEDTDGCPDLDDDRDGIPDTADACRLEPETVNRHEDTDGCPDTVPDTDGDGLTDDVDACPAQPEDRDGFEDENGCPDPDNDGDGVLDADDRCVSEPGVAAEQGCPVRDRDADSVADLADNCPDEPGTVEFQGCREAQRVTITGEWSPHHRGGLLQDQRGRHPPAQLPAARERRGRAPRAPGDHPRARRGPHRRPRPPRAQHHAEPASRRVGRPLPGRPRPDRGHAPRGTRLRTGPPARRERVDGGRTRAEPARRIQHSRWRRGRSAAAEGGRR